MIHGSDENTYGVRLDSAGAGSGAGLLTSGTFTRRKDKEKDEVLLPLPEEIISNRSPYLMESS